MHETTSARNYPIIAGRKKRTFRHEELIEAIDLHVLQRTVVRNLQQVMQEREKCISESERTKKMKTTEISSNGLTAAQQALSDLWDEHVRNEFATKDADAALATMTPDAYVNHVPVLTGGVGKEELREFYANHFIPKMPADIEIVPISRTIGSERVVDEMIIRFTHTIEIDWLLPGIPATGKRVELPTVAIVQFRDGKLFNEHIYWDQASVLVQLGLLDSANLPVVGVEVARKVADPTLPSNQIMKHAGNSR